MVEKKIIGETGKGIEMREYLLVIALTAVMAVFIISESCVNNLTGWFYG